MFHSTTQRESKSNDRCDGDDMKCHSPMFKSRLNPFVTGNTLDFSENPRRSSSDYDAKWHRLICNVMIAITAGSQQWTIITLCTSSTCTYIDHVNDAPNEISLPAFDLRHAHAVVSLLTQTVQINSIGHAKKTLDMYDSILIVCLLKKIFSAQQHAVCFLL